MTLVIFNAMTGYALYTCSNRFENLSFNAFDVNQLLFGILNITMIIIGNIMSKLRMNLVVGLKTKWSMKNETTWKKSQHFGGISFIIGGVVIIVICFFTEEMCCFLLTMAIILFSYLLIFITLIGLPKSKTRINS